MENAYEIIKQLLYSFSMDVNAINKSLIADLKKEEMIKEYLVQYSQKITEIIYGNITENNFAFLELDEAIFDGNILVNSKKVYIPFEKIEGIGAIVINKKAFSILMVGVNLKQYILTNTNEEIRNKLQELKQTIKN